MKLADFDYLLPKELIAQYPLEERDSCRLLVLHRKDGLIEHRIFKNIREYLQEDDLLVLNDTEVLPCRLKGRRLTGGKAEILLLERKEGFTFKALVRPSRLRVNEKIIFNNGKIFCYLTARNEVTFFAPNIETVYRQGLMPLPPYIKRPSEGLDNIYYQTVYARKKGSVAAPTAGLHFTTGLLEEIKRKGINIAYLTLQINYSTFRPVKEEDITRHQMDKEDFYIGQETLNLIQDTRTNKGRIFCVGTTSLRALEGYGSLGQSQGATDLFIYPGYAFKIADCLLTNFHLPKTTLFMLVCAFAGEPLIKKTYQEAIDKKYRFYSYGDAMLII